MWIKICGITNIETALFCAEAGADAVGFVFAESKRRIRVEKAEKIIEQLPPGLETVGVFVDQKPVEVAAINGYLNLDLLQFHGLESPKYCSFFPGQVIKSFRIGASHTLPTIRSYQGKVKACLFDSYEKGRAGGTGRPWDWGILYSEFKNNTFGIPLIAAGGLNSQNVIPAIKTLNPKGIDTSSGVESSGKKDHLLIGEFIETVRRYEKSELTG
ncbi:MAG: phosphoribosylanthranilate isomerase [Bacillota bacterium]